MAKVLHVTAHLGGGVGNVLSSVACYAKKIGSDFEHEIIELEPTENTHFVDICKQNNITVYPASEINIQKEIGTSDILQVEWWHHPLTMKFMFDYLQTNTCRFIVWSHISGCNYPCTPASFVKLPEKFIFASPYSFENPSWSETERSEIKDLASVVVSSSGNFPKEPVAKTYHHGFNIGYIGFLNYNKTNPDFVKYCSAIDIPEVCFTVVGDTAFGDELISDVKKAEMWNKFNFTGYSTNVSRELSTFDVFGCLLNNQHTGTAENSLLEAMAAGVPPVILNQCSEKYTVKDGETGLVVNSIDEYANAMRYLYQNPKVRLKIGENASRYIKEQFSINITVLGLEQIYSRVLMTSKKRHDISRVFGSTPADWFSTCLRKDEEMLHHSNLMFGKSKGSIYQYMKYYPFDKKLKKMYNSLLLNYGGKQ